MIRLLQSLIPERRADNSIIPRSAIRGAVAFLVIGFQCVTLAAELDRSTLLLLDFDANDAATRGQSLVYTNGSRGRGAFVSEASQLTIASANHINPTNGTLEFWIRPSWNGDDRKSHCLLRWGSAGGMFFGKDSGNVWRCMFNRFGAGGLRERGVGVSVAAEWKSNEWHHVAFAWNTESIRLFIDGQVRARGGSMDLPSVKDETLQIGRDGNGSFADATIDELRILNRTSSEAEIQQDFFAELDIQSLAILPAQTNLLQTWSHVPTVMARTATGPLSIPAGGVSWKSSDNRIASVDVKGRIVGQRAGPVTLTASFKTAVASLQLEVTPPIRPAEVDAINPFLAKPAAGALYEMPVMVINYIPTRDGTNVDSAILGKSTIADFKKKLLLFNKRTKFMLEEGSRYHGYQNNKAPPSLGYRVVHMVTAYEIMPPGKRAGGKTSPEFFPDYNQILNRFDAGPLITNRNVKEIWLWGYHTAGIVPVESNMSSPVTGDISNSSRFEDDLPVYDRTFVLYNYNSMRWQAEAVHNHGHQFESILSFVNKRQDGNTELFWNKFCGRQANGKFQQGRCGNTHFPPNALQDYDYLNQTLVESDCEDWTPARTGKLKPVNAGTWGGLPYRWPEGTEPSPKTESQYYIYWMQNMPGHENNITHGERVMNNWWQFTADWDRAIRQELGLYK